MSSISSKLLFLHIREEFDGQFQTLTLVNAKKLEKNVHSIDGVINRKKLAIEKWRLISSVERMVVVAMVLMS